MIHERFLICHLSNIGGLPSIRCVPIIIVVVVVDVVVIFPTAVFVPFHIHFVVSVGSNFCIIGINGILDPIKKEAKSTVAAIIGITSIMVPSLALRMPVFASDPLFASAAAFLVGAINASCPEISMMLGPATKLYVPAGNNALAWVLATIGDGAEGLGPRRRP